jgi:hypothetical protein
VLKGKNHYIANVAETPLGTIRSVEYTAQNLEERLSSWQRDLTEAEKNSRELETKIGQPFEHESKLQSLARRQQELENALDITKNQAANSLSAEESNERENAPTQNHCRARAPPRGKRRTQNRLRKILMRSPFQFRPANSAGFRAKWCAPTFRLREAPRSILPLRCACQGIARPRSRLPLRSTLTVLTSQSAALRNSRSRPSSLRLFQEERSGSQIYVTVARELRFSENCHRFVT